MAAPGESGRSIDRIAGAYGRSDDGIGPRHYVGVLGLAKVADAVTTVVGLSAFPSVTETNPALRVLVEHLGVLVAVALGSAVVVGVIVLATELAAVACRRLAPGDERPVSVVRVVGYVPISIVFLAAAGHNALLVLRVTGYVP